MEVVEESEEDNKHNTAREEMMQQPTSTREAQEQRTVSQQERGGYCRERGRFNNHKVMVWVVYNVRFLFKIIYEFLCGSLRNTMQQPTSVRR